MKEEDKPDKPGVPAVPEPKAKSHPHPPKGRGKGGRSSLPNGEKRPCYFYLVKRNCRNGKDCPFSQDTKLRDKAEKAGPPKSRSASPKGRGDKVCRNFQKGNCKRATSARILTSLISRRQRQSRLPSPLLPLVLSRRM